MKKLTDKELAIMNVLWDNGALSMRDLLERMPEPQPNFNTLTTFVRRLEVSGMIKHQDIGQMNMYLNYFKSEVGSKSDAEPVGIVLGANKDDLVVQFATQGISNRLFVSKYQLYLPDETQLREKLAALLDEASKRKTKRISPRKRR